MYKLSQFFILLGFRPPHRNTVRRNLIGLYEKQQKKLLIELNTVNFIAITTDTWCDNSARSYLCMTGHWYTDSMNLKSKVISFAPFSNRHTSENIAFELGKNLKQFHILDKITTITSDGANNIKAACKSIDSKIQWLHCLAHRLHLVICNGLGLWLKNPEEEYKLDFYGMLLNIESHCKAHSYNSVL